MTEAPSPAPPADYREWCKRHGVCHGHCPCGCEKPQPVMHAGRLVCGCCLIVHGAVCDMIPCTPDVCD
jgi:hypothetical protein